MCLCVYVPLFYVPMCENKVDLRSGESEERKRLVKTQCSRLVFLPGQRVKSDQKVFPWAYLKVPCQQPVNTFLKNLTQKSCFPQTYLPTFAVHWFRKRIIGNAV
jgi:hypothetical protein